MTLHPHRTIRLAGLLGLGLAACTVENGADEQVAVDMEPIVGGVAAAAYPEAAYLNIDSTAAMYWACSGTLIAPQVVLTAGHCVVGHHQWDVHVGTAYRSSTSAAVYDWPVLDSDTVNPHYHDVGLVFLPTPIVLASAYPSVAVQGSPSGTKAINVGRDIGPNAPDFQVTTTLYEASVTLGSTPSYPYDYSSNDVIQPGDSGGPVFLSGTHTILAVNSGASPGVMQVLARVDLVSSWISAQVASHGGSSVSSPPVDASAPDAAARSDASAQPSADAAAKVDAGAEPVPEAAAKPEAAPAKDAAGAPDAAAAPDAAPGPGPDASAKPDALPPPAAPPSGPDSGSNPEAGAAANQSCPATETEPNNSWATASHISTSVCGALSSAADVDWYSATLSSGTHSIGLVASGDATMSLGVATGATCVFALQSVTKANVTIQGGSANICVQVTSRTKSVQSYHVDVAF